MRHEDLPERWKQKVRDYLIAKGETKHEKLGASDFAADNTVLINFEDDSKVEFKNAFVIEAPEFKETAVFTEHCGYHIFFSYHGLDWTLRKEENDESTVPPGPLA